MKDFDVEYLGKVPSCWELKRLRFLSKINPVKSEVAHLLPNTKVSFIPMEAVGKFGGLALNQAQARSIKDVYQGYTYCRTGDILIAKITPCFENGKGSIATRLVNNIAFGTTELHVVRAGTQLDRRFLFYLTISPQFRQAGAAEMYGAGGQKRIPDFFIRNFVVPLPAVEEQKLIAEYLDVRLFQIDNLMKKKQRQIELLQEKYIALISRAVTKGLDPKAKMKASGVEYFGKIPLCWDLKRLRFLSKINPAKSEVAYPLSDIKVSFAPMKAVGEFGGLALDQTRSIKDVYQGYTYFLAKDILIPKLAPCFENGKGSIATGLVNNIAFGTTELHVVRPGIQLDRQFLFYLTISLPFRQAGAAEIYGAAQKRIPGSFIRNFIIPLPTVKEQKMIVKYLDTNLSKNRILLQKLQESINLLCEYRTALISSVITGKIDFRQRIT